MKNRGSSYTKWEEKGNKSPHFDGFKLYVIEFKEEDGTQFFKIGKTFNPINTRIQGIKVYKPLNTISIQGIAKFCSKLELMMHRALKDYRYKPQLKFEGSTECFTQIPDDILITLKSFTNT